MKGVLFGRGVGTMSHSQRSRLAIYKWKVASALALAVVGFIVAPVGASTAPTCTGGTNPYGDTPEVLAACGLTTYPLSSSGTLPDGGSSYTYEINGTSVTFNVPPAHFNPVSATEEQLKAYGIPARPSPSSGVAFAQWVLKYRHAHIQTPPPSLISAPLVNTPLITSNWSGYIATNSSSTYYDFVNTQFVQPSNTVSTCTGGTGISLGSIWAGLGGHNTNYLAQDGTYFGSSDSSVAANGQFWFEFYPSNPDIDSAGDQTSTLLPDVAAAGDVVEASVTYNSGTNYSLELYDTTNTDLYTLTANAPSGFTPDGSTAEFIIETPQLSSNGVVIGYANLPDFVSDNFDYASVGHLMSIAYLSTYTHQSVTMEPGSTPYATAGSLGTDSSFTDTYGGCSG
jgi:hypothetical protein